MGNRSDFIGDRNIGDVLLRFAEAQSALNQQARAQRDQSERFRLQSQQEQEAERFRQQVAELAAGHRNFEQLLPLTQSQTGASAIAPALIQEQFQPPKQPGIDMDSSQKLFNLNAQQAEAFAKLPAEKQFPALEFIDKQRERANKVAINSAKQKAAGQKLTSTQFLAAGYANRVADATKIIDGLDADPEFDAGSLIVSLQKGEMLGIGIPEGAKSPKVKQLEQAQRNFINAVLRKESGANIAKPEFESASLQYFTQPGEAKGKSSEELAKLKEQKRNNRLRALAALKAEAGDAFGLVQQEFNSLVGDSAAAAPQAQSSAGGITDQQIAEAEAVMSKLPPEKQVILKARIEKAKAARTAQ